MTSCTYYTVILHLLSYIVLGQSSTWSEWWTYEGISGPGFWGLVNSEWSLCSKGKRQSPINLDPKTLLYDPSLKHVHVDKHRVTGTLMNTGHEVKMRMEEPSPRVINISGGPLSYQYRVHDLLIHFGSIDSLGSEHTINGQSFPAEIQIIGYNTDLYGNMSQAVLSPNGLAIISILVQVGDTPNREFEMLAREFKQIKYKGHYVKVGHFSVFHMLPDTQAYMTYEGSITYPGCHETATWMVMNKPMYITNDQLVVLRDIMQGDESNPQVPMENNARPTMPVNHRVVRTNINFPHKSRGCTMERETNYQANTWNRS